MARYIDGFLIPIKKKDVKAYKKMATIGRKIWMKHGALDYFECVGAKLENEWGLTFTKMCKLKPSETVVFAYVVYKSKAHRDRVNKKVHSDPMMNPTKPMKMPFDPKRFAVGEFKTLVHT